jgi:type IX secretion system PorP/SprF family membrane protein
MLTMKYLNMLKVNLFFILILTASVVSAQQEGQVTQFMFTKLLYNPAYAGNVSSPQLLGMYRQQWIGLDGAPTMQLLSYNQSSLDGRVGFGATVSRFSVGISQFLSVDPAYAYRIQLPRGELSMGLQMSIRQFSQNWTDSRIKPTEPNDPALQNLNINKLLLNVGAGVYYNAQNWFAGISVPRMVRTNIDFANDSSRFSTAVLHGNAMAGYQFGDPEGVVIMPQFIVKYAENSPVNADINLSFLFNNTFFSGVTYRTGNGVSARGGESAGFFAGVQATKNIMVCLSYDLGITALRNYNNGTIEAVVRWSFRPPDDYTVIHTPLR